MLNIADGKTEFRISNRMNRIFQYKQLPARFLSYILAKTTFEKKEYNFSASRRLCCKYICTLVVEGQHMFFFNIFAGL